MLRLTSSNDSRAAGAGKRRGALLMSAAIGLVTAAFAAPPAASADPGYVDVRIGRGFVGPGHYYGPGRFAHPVRFYGGRHGFRRGWYGPGRRHYRRGGISAGEAFGITAGIIGGAILLDRALDDGRRQIGREVIYLPKHPPDYDAWADRPDLDPRYRGPGDYFEPGIRYDRRRDRDDALDGVAEERRLLEEERRALAEERERFEEERRRYLESRNVRDRRDDPEHDYGEVDDDPDADVAEEDLEPDFLERELRPSPIRPVPDREARGTTRSGDRPDQPGADGRQDDLDDELLGAPDATARRIAFDQCSAEIRRVAAAEGLLIALPDAPTEDAADIGGGAVRLSAAFTAAGDDGYRYRRLMVCDVDRQGVRRLEIV